MELQRAKSEILRCKLKIRNLFQQLNSLISEGKLDHSLFDSEGEICSEDIFCAKCISKDVSLENDIILCDGICDRGFHQMCLDPPLLKDDIPPGDEGWLCPGCDCKVDCLDLINETQGTDLSVEDEWEKVFPEAAVFASKNGQNDDLELPSDDSEDGDYDPENMKADKELEEGSSSDESDFTSTSEDSEPSNRNLRDESFGFPSDDSEDIDYDPDKPNLEQKAAEDSSSSDESDFTSDTDDLNIPDNDTSDVNEVSAYPASKFPVSVSHSDKESDARDTNKSAAKSLLPPLESGIGQEIVVPLSGKRHRERFDYKKLYDDAYGNNLSDSSDDEEWTHVTTPNKLDCDATREDTEGLRESHVETVQNRRSSKRIKGKQKTEDKDGVCAEMTENSQKTKICRELQTGLANHSIDKQSLYVAQPDSSEKKISPSSTRNGAAAFQKLQQSFRENQYPSHEIKESLARELGMNVKQVSKWFDKARHSFRVSANAVSPRGTSSTGATSHSETSDSCIKHQKLEESFGENQYPSREVKERLAGELNMTLQQVSKWFGNARHRFRVLADEMSPAGLGFVGATSHGETSNTTSTQEAVGSNGPRRGRQPKKLGESRRVNTLETQNGRASTKAANGGSTSREILVMRELRKRRLSKYCLATVMPWPQTRCHGGKICGGCDDGGSDRQQQPVGGTRGGGRHVSVRRGTWPALMMSRWLRESHPTIRISERVCRFLTGPDWDGADIDRDPVYVQAHVQPGLRKARHITLSTLSVRRLASGAWRLAVNDRRLATGARLLVDDARYPAVDVWHSAIDVWRPTIGGRRPTVR
ncbi:hypothetical protein Taro_026817, partial [Colocasia esculenta]|nr:hypothetical protein [Colocasia esculenta]